LTALETQAPMLNPSTGTLDWIPNQLLHSDTDPNNGMSWTSDQFIGLVATTAGTTYVRVITGSHHLKDDVYRKRKHIHVIALQQYDYFVAKPTLIHGGSTNKPYKDDDPSCDDSFAAANMTRRSMKGTVPLSLLDCLPENNTATLNNSETPAFTFTTTYPQLLRIRRIFW